MLGERSMNKTTTAQTWKYMVENDMIMREIKCQLLEKGKTKLNSNM